MRRRILAFHHHLLLEAVWLCKADDTDTLTAHQVEAQQLAKVFAKHCFRSVLAVNEFVTLASDGAVLAFRVTAAHSLDAAAREVRMQPTQFVVRLAQVLTPTFEPCRHYLRGSCACAGC